MCGDPYCPSCGPAQGNHRCPICGTWSADGPCPDPERCAAESRKADDALAAQLVEEEKAAREYFAREALSSGGRGSRFLDNEDGGTLDEKDPDEPATCEDCGDEVHPDATLCEACEYDRRMAANDAASSGLPADDSGYGG
jgi:hypothetical protein